MPDKGIQIIVALLEKRESFLLTKETDQRLARELLRAESLGYVQKEQKSDLYTLSEMGRRFVYSGYLQEEFEPVNTSSPPRLPPEIPPSPTVVLQTGHHEGKGDLRPAYASTFLITALFFLTILIIWLLEPR